ncbi:ImuA family protein [Paracoccus alkenifer]|uniref:Protein ImuA n=1 Tax=Paracoccus alkenifer TaxID=65735 RepID=A0A1H6MEP5_9RHOB|nr:damage-inducible protein [Paracoccus alkenifer]SEH99953.1 protein ImuA [Paracoccus alkenifer]
MSSRPLSPALVALRARIARIEAGDAARPQVLPFGIAPFDRSLPGGGLALGCLHEVAGQGDGAAATGFVAGIAARTRGGVLWCVARQDLFAPGLEQSGLPPDRVIHVEAGDDRAVLACMEEGLRHGGLGAVIGDIARLPMVASRRLHLAARESGTLCLALRRWGPGADGDFGQPTAAMTRWRVSALPSAPLPVPGVGRARWRIELVRARAGEGFEIELEACDGTGHLGLPADMAGGPAAAAGGRRRAPG